MTGLPQWSARVPKWKVARLYENDAAGLVDDDLIADVAYALLLRCQDVLVVDRARAGVVDCPGCGEAIRHDADRESVLDCPSCTWALPWVDYRGSLDGEHLIAPGLVPFCRAYVDEFDSAASQGERMLLIDALIHRSHWEGTAIRGQPGATTFIEGRATDVNAFLAELSAGRTRPATDESGRWSAEEHERARRWRDRAVGGGRVRR